MSAELPAAYLDTVFILQDPPDPLPLAFAIVTAFNPMDEAQSPDENWAADLRLQGRLAAVGWERFRATGCSPDQSHTEPGWAIVCPLDAAVDLARHFNQRAIWWIEHDQLHLIGCENPNPQPVARFSDRVLPS
ncbi:DUF3293 domain-containing protein [Haloferula chungangensis]|uniref:DUF3293 domain-containing protein n=1 Tax=Haloferula chungangensis TaxID=1048331 RepID=A0ABW2KZW1_9BACT